jgi:hypothetical protein
VIDRQVSDAEIATMAQRDDLDLPSHLPSLEVRRQSDGAYVATAWQAGAYQLVMSDGASICMNVDQVAEPQAIEGPWEVRFPPGEGAPNAITLDQLISWTEHEHPGVKYFSGTATYVKRFQVSEDAFEDENRLYLDLGDVSVIADVKLNGQTLGVLWKPPFRSEVTDVLQPGENSLEVRVTNLWPNRLIGDEQFPADIQYRSNGGPVDWPDWIRSGGPRPEPRRLTFSSWKHFHKTSPLLQSGLAGPVVIRTARQRTIASDR